MHKFTIKDNNIIKTFNNFDDIPLEFDHLIEFVPYMPPPPHTEAEHEEIESWQEKFKTLLERQRFK